MFAGFFGSKALVFLFVRPLRRTLVQFQAIEPQVFVVRAVQYWFDVDSGTACQAGLAKAIRSINTGDQKKFRLLVVN